MEDLDRDDRTPLLEVKILEPEADADVFCPSGDIRSEINEQVEAVEVFFDDVKAEFEKLMDEYSAELPIFEKVRFLKALSPFYNGRITDFLTYHPDSLSKFIETLQTTALKCFVVGSGTSVYSFFKEVLNEWARKEGLDFSLPLESADQQAAVYELDNQFRTEAFFEDIIADLTLEKDLNFFIQCYLRERLAPLVKQLEDLQAKLGTALGKYQRNYQYVESDRRENLGAADVFDLRECVPGMKESEWLKKDQLETLTKQINAIVDMSERLGENLDRFRTMKGSS